VGFKNSLRKLFYQVRAIPNKLELRPYRVYIVTTTSSGAELGEGTVIPSVVEITESDNAPPRVEQLNSEEMALGGYSEDTFRVGPVTPDFPGGGTLLSVLAPNPTGSNPTVRVRLDGPRWPSGGHFEIKEVRHAKTFGYVLIVSKTAD